MQRSLATAPLRRMRGVWPSGAPACTPPFGAHARVEADGVPVGEPDSTVLYRRLITVPHLTLRTDLGHEARPDRRGHPRAEKDLG